MWQWTVAPADPDALPATPQAGIWWGVPRAQAFQIYARTPAEPLLRGAYGVTFGWQGIELRAAGARSRRQLACGAVPLGVLPPLQEAARAGDLRMGLLVWRAARTGTLHAVLFGFLMDGALAAAWDEAGADRLAPMPWDLACRLGEVPVLLGTYRGAVVGRDPGHWQQAAAALGEALLAGTVGPTDADLVEQFLSGPRSRAGAPFRLEAS